MVAAVIPATNGFLHDSRAQISGGRLLYELAVSILLLTAIPEEFAFRGVLLGSALRLWGPLRASLVTSVLFGLWHIAPTLHTMRTTAPSRACPPASPGRCWWCSARLRSRSPPAWSSAGSGCGRRSLIAPVLAHFATNGLALAVAWFTVHHRPPAVISRRPR